MMEYTYLILGGIGVLFAAVIFTNGIEYLGYKMNWSGSFVGAILAPLFTSFPELTVFLVAVFAYGGLAGEEIGIGTLYGQPFMASSLSYGLVGILAVVGYYLHNRDDLVLEVEKTLVIPYIFITVLFPFTLVPALFPSLHMKILFSSVFLGGYVFYIWLMYTRRAMEYGEEEVEEPYFKRFLKNEYFSLSIQLIVSVVLLYYSSDILVSSVDSISKNLNIEPIAISLIAIPAVTAIPETASAMIWGYKGKDTLSIASLVGEKILYSTFYPGIGILVTSWFFDIHAMFSVIATTIVSLILLYYIYRQAVPWYALIVGFIFFIVYAYMIFLMHM